MNQTLMNQTLIKKVDIFPLTSQHKRLNWFTCRMWFADYTEPIDEQTANDIIEACENASLNLRYRHRIFLTHVDVWENYIDIELIVPPEKFRLFSFNKLRGIGRYLLSKDPEKYTKRKVGNRLFCYRRRMI